MNNDEGIKRQTFLVIKLNPKMALDRVVCNRHIAQPKIYCGN